MAIARVTPTARKSYGLHLLASPVIAEKMVGHVLDEMKRLDLHELLEIGPGEGALTQKIFDHWSDEIQRLTLIEKNPDLIAHWTQKLTGEMRNIRLVSGDFLEVE